MKTILEKNMELLLDLPKDSRPLIESIQESRENQNSVEKVSDNELEDDYQYARRNLKDIIDNAQTAIDDLSRIASTSESPRAYEVLSNLIKTVSDANQGLLDLQKKLKQIKNETSNNDKPQSVTNALFVGSTSDLQKLIRQTKE